MDDLLRLVIDEDASDLHISVGVPPTLRIKGALTKLSTAPLAPEDAETLVRAIATEQQFEKLNTEGSADFAISFRDNNRFRVNIYREKGHCAAAVRLLPTKLMSLEQIGLPPAMRDLLDLPRGLVLVTGPTGSGKTTSLASMLTVINETSSRHIITIEDPIEYYLDHKRGIVNQREIGVDVPSFADGLRRALRQDPDVILVGEMRDLETIETAITAAETGHLVFSSLHTTGAARTIDRIIDAFPADRQEQIRVQMSTNLKGTLSQVLLPRADGKGRVAAFDLMLNTPAIAALIRDNKSFRIHSEILTGSKHGMLALENSLVDLYQRGLITRDTVLLMAQDPVVARQLMGEAIAV
ncbi:MAG: twitching motility protein PilT [Chthoniobacter sp.]|nr:twitching motility protein PilT [Chthoniobacter sp.]